jgi:endonuclease/exonuclease/phosphatase family metal-dependent hydrolase
MWKSMLRIARYAFLAAYVSGCAASAIPLAVSSKQGHGLAAPVSLRIATFNIQDTYIVSENRAERMRAIAGKLGTLDPDIVGFQESFIKKDRGILIGELKGNSRLQYHQYYPSRVAGSGLLISSAFPITETAFLRFRDSNPIYKITEGDWWAGKGVALARIELPDGAGFVDFFNTHAQADYGASTYTVVRRNQMAELAGFVNRSREGAGPALLVGDMNSRIDGDGYRTAVKEAKLRRVMNVDSAIDHIFAVEDPRYTFQVLGTVEIAGKILGKKDRVPLSDHHGYVSTVLITPVTRIGSH